MLAVDEIVLSWPALAPPPGVIPNFVDPENVFVSFVVTMALCLSTSTVIFWMRMYAKIYILQRLGWEDYTALLGWLMYVGYCVPCTLGIYNGRGAHQWNVHFKTLFAGLYYINIGWTIYGINITIIKISILLQYLKIFIPVRRTTVMVRGSYLVIWITIIFYLITTFFIIFACSPREKFWNRLIADGHCFNIDIINIITAIINCISDFIILLLPQGVIWKLQMPLKQKFGISAIFLTGFFVFVTSILRLYYAIKLLETQDVTYYAAMIGLWTHAEIAVGIICSCLPVLPIFFQTMWPKIIIRKRPRLSILNGFKDLPSDFNGNSTGTLRQTYELHDHFHSSGQNEVQPMERGANTISHLTTQMIRPPPVFSRDVAMDTTCMEDRRNNRQILKTVTIETVLEPRDRLASDVEKKERPPW